MKQGFSGGAFSKQNTEAHATRPRQRPSVLPYFYFDREHWSYTCQFSHIMHESRACGSKIVISRIQTNFSRLTDISITQLVV